MKLYRSKNAADRILKSYDRLLQMWQIEAEELEIPGTYGTTHAIRFGGENKPPLVLFHGVGDDSALMWLYNAKALGTHFRVFAIDTMGGPGKSRPNENYNKNFDYAVWIDEVLAGLTLSQVCIAGVSHGAYLAQAYALQRLEKVKKLVCMAGSVPVDHSKQKMAMLKIFLPEALFPTRQNTIRLLKKLSGGHYDVFTGNPAVLEHYHALLSGFNNMAMAHHKLISFGHGQLASIRGKALYLMGEEDPFAKMGARDALIRHRMNAKFYPKVGHGINHEISDEINREIISFLSI